MHIKSIIILTVTSNKEYTDKAVDKFRSRWNNSKTDERKASSGNIERCKQQFLQNHFL